MSEKPSLYVVEKKEVVILVVLFVLVTVLSFTIGVRYGESVGKKAAIEKKEAEEEVGGHEAEKIGGKLESSDSKVESLGGSEHPAEQSEHAVSEEKENSKNVSKTEEKPELAAGKDSAGKDSADKDSDEYLLNALKDSGVEPPGGKAPDNSALPQEVKKAPKSGTYVIQVGSHPTRTEAESQIKKLQAKNVLADILPPFKDRQGEWHRVVISGFKSKRDAEREASQLKGKGAFSSFFVWRLP
jgi:cell division protein FtsN